MKLFFFFSYPLISIQILFPVFFVSTFFYENGKCAEKLKEQYNENSHALHTCRSGMGESRFIDALQINHTIIVKY